MVSMMNETPKTVQLLESLGLSNYEAKAYAGLLVKNPVTGYRLSEISGVPRSRIYETLEKLSRKGFVQIKQSKPKNYTPIAGEEFLDRTTREVSGKIDELRTHIEDMDNSVAVQPGIWNIEGRNNIVAKISYFLKKASSHISICAWAEDLQELQQEIENAAERSVSVSVISFGDFAAEGVGKIFTQRRNENLKDMCRDFTMIVDRKTLLIGSTMPTDKCTIAITQEPGMVYTCRELLFQKVVIGKMEDDIPEEIQRGIDAFYSPQMR